MLVRKDFKNRESRIEGKSTSEENLLLSNELKSKEFIVVNSPIDVFRNYYTGTNYSKLEELFSVVSTEDEAIKSFNQIKDYVQKNPKEFDFTDGVSQNFYIMLRKVNPNRLYLQKMTYQVEENEDFDKVVNTLKEANSYALFKAISFNKESRIIESYSSTDGLWTINSQMNFRKIQANSGVSVRSSFGIYKKDEDKYVPLKDISKINLAVYEDGYALVQNEVIESFSFYTENEKCEWSRGAVNYDKNLLVPKENDESLQVKRVINEVSREIKKENSPLGISNASKKEMKRTLDNNELEMHIEHYQVDDNVSTEKRELESRNIEEESMQGYLDSLIKKEEEEALKRVFTVKEKVNQARGQFEKAKKEFYQYLNIGKTSKEALLELDAKGYNDITINLVEETLKTEALNSYKKSSEILALQGEKVSLEVSLDKIMQLNDKLEDKNKNLLRRIESLNEGLEFARAENKQLKKDMYEAHTAINKLENIYKDITQKSEELMDLNNSLNVDISELKVDIKEKDREISELEEQNNTYYDEIEDIKVQLERSQLSKATLDKRYRSLIKETEEIKADLEDSKVKLKLLIDKAT
jgi:septal ring factor EnvC (AmiA/AmiB activator)